MRNCRIPRVMLVGCYLPPGIAGAENCNRFVISSNDGYTNVRSQPRVSDDNLVAAIPTGAVIAVDGALGEVYVDAITDWALNEPAALAAALRGQSDAIRDAAMAMIDLGLTGAPLEKHAR